MATLTNRGIPLSSVCPRYLHTNSTSHTWPFSAIAELIDNAYDPDVNAKQIWIDKTVIKDQDCLIIMDNGNGMDCNKMHKMLSFGFSDKHTVRGHVPVGLYGNGFKSGSMRLGKDAIVFSKKAGTMCVGLLSQTYLEKIKAQNVIVPIVVFNKTGQTVSAAIAHTECLHDILKYSLFNTKEELMSEFSVIDGLCTKSSGTRIIIWNLRRRSSGELEFDFTKDRYDIQIPVDVYDSTRKTKKQQLEDGTWMPESEYSLRAYCSILYLKPRTQIIIQGQKVEAQFVTKSLANVFKDTYRPACLEKGITITFGYNTRNKEHYGLMMYHKNRLIKAYERVPCQRKSNSTGVGVIGVIECNYLTPTHNKQAFDNTEEYRKTMLSVGNKLEDYWKEVRYRLKKNLNCTEPAEDIVKRPDQIWVQCDDCLKWRKLPDCIDPKQLPKKWFCRMNSDPQFRSCSAEEEPEDYNDERPRYRKTYKQDERNQKLQEQKMLQSPCTPRSSVQMTLKPSDDTSNDNSVLTTPKRKKKSLDLSQENPKQKKARRKGFDSNIPDTSTYLSALLSPASDTDEAECEIIEIVKDDVNDVIDKSMEKKEQSNQNTQTISEDQQNFRVLYPQAMEEIQQLQQKHRETVKKALKEKEDGLCALSNCRERLKNYSEDLTKENEKVIVSTEDRGVQTDFYICYNEKRATNSAETSNPRRKQERDLQPQFLCSHAGQFHCKLTNLVFEMKGNGEVMYTVVSWDNSQLQGMGKFQPAGPLYNINCSGGSIRYLHLPHCEIHTDKIHAELAVAHFNEGNMEILQPVKVTDTHVIIDVQHLSLYGLLKKLIFKESPIRAQVLLFYQKVQVRRKLHIHLLPENVPVKEVQNQHEGNTYINCSSTCQLIPGKIYRPVCNPYVSQPKAEIFSCDYGPNYHPTFEVIFHTEVEDLTLSLVDEFAREVWAPRHVIFTADNREAVPEEMDNGAEFVDKHRDMLIQRVSSIMEIADTLLTQTIITNEMYNQIKEPTTSQGKMRILYGFLDSGGRAVKAEFYRVLKEKDRYLVNDLKISYR